MPVHAGRSGGTMSKCVARSFAVLLALALCAPAFAEVPMPAPGASPRIDAIKKAGVLRVGVLANAPWLVENTTGRGDAWSGPAWLLANEYAKRLSVKLEAVLGCPRTQGPAVAIDPVGACVVPRAHTRTTRQI